MHTSAHLDTFKGTMNNACWAANAEATRAVELARKKRTAEEAALPEMVWPLERCALPIKGTAEFKALSKKEQKTVLNAWAKQRSRARKRMRKERLQNGGAEEPDGLEAPAFDAADGLAHCVTQGGMEATEVVALQQKLAEVVAALSAEKEDRVRVERTLRAQLADGPTRAQYDALQAPWPPAGSCTYSCMHT